MPPSDEGGGTAKAVTEGENLSPSLLTQTAPSSEGAFDAEEIWWMAKKYGL